MPPKWKKKAKMVTKDDPIMKDPRPTDIIIPIMGPTGSGKSTFVNLLLGKQTVRVGHDLESCTAKLNPIIIEAKDWISPTETSTDRRLVIVDTPGFDDTYIDDSEILRRISVWLAASYSDSMQLAGVIFLQEISQMRMFRTTRRNTDVFKKLCGDEIMTFVVLGTTKWELVDQEVGKAREKQLKDQYWKDMIDHHAQSWPIFNTSESAWKTVNEIIKKHTVYNQYLQIQTELVDLQKILPETEAGKSLRLSLQEALEIQKKRMRGISARGNIEPHRDEDEEIKNTLRQISALSVPVPRRIWAALFRGV